MGFAICEFSFTSGCWKVDDERNLFFTDRSVQVLENHQRGVLSVAWCQHDPDLLLTCGKDNRVICWNPNSSPPEVTRYSKAMAICKS